MQFEREAMGEDGFTPNHEAAVSPTFSGGPNPTVAKRSLPRRFIDLSPKAFGDHLRTSSMRSIAVSRAIISGFFFDPRRHERETEFAIQARSVNFWDSLHVHPSGDEQDWSGPVSRYHAGSARFALYH
jgi:hypothetical protein